MSHLPSKPNHSLLHVLADHQGIAAPLLDVSEAIMRGPSPFSPAERELIFYCVSTVNDCAFCIDSHAVALRKFGVSDEVLASVREAGRAPGKMEAVLQYARKLTREPHSVTRADVDALIAAGWDETAVVHAAYACAMANFYNRVVEGLGIVSDHDLITAGGDMLHKHGYGPLKPMLGAFASKS